MHTPVNTTQNKARATEYRTHGEVHKCLCAGTKSNAPTSAGTGMVTSDCGMMALHFHHTRTDERTHAHKRARTCKQIKTVLGWWAKKHTTSHTCVDMQQPIVGHGYS